MVSLREKSDGRKIFLDGHNGREYMLPELPHHSVDGFCPETKILYEFFACCFNGHTCQSVRDVSTMSGDTLAERYEHTMARIEQITRAGYQKYRGSASLM